MKPFSPFLFIVFIFLTQSGTSQTITTGTISGSPFCAGSSVNIPYTITGTYNSGNVFRAQLSDASGNFGATPTVIGSLTSRNAGTIAGVIPSTTPAGNNYRIRVVSTNPIRTGSTSSSILTIKTLGACNVAGALLDDLDDVTIASPANGQVLSYNGSAWVNSFPVGGSTGWWSLTGNSGLNASNNFIGTTDEQDLIFKTNNIVSGILSPTKRNSSWGMNSLIQNTTGSSNTSVGSFSLWNNTTGSVNSAFGYSALQSNTSGNYNVGLGYQSLVYNQTGQFNVAIGGRDASFKNVDGWFNVAVGSGALYNNLANNNTAIGNGALDQNKTGSENTGIGLGANVTLDNLTNATAIGYGALVNASNKVRIGNTSVTVIEGQVAMTTSDGRFKSNIKADAPGLALIMKLKPVTYNFQYSRFSEFLKEKAVNKQHLKEKDGKKEIGLVAQEVEKACKELGIEISNLVHVPENENDNYALAYGQLVVPLVKAVQELSTQNDSLIKKNKDLESRLDRIEKILKELESPASTKPETGQQVIPATLANKARLEQNIPNPFSNNTSIDYFIPDYVNQAAIQVTDLNGRALQSISINKKGNGRLLLNTAQLTIGTYYYSLLIDGQVLETRKMILNR